ncbi:MAG: alpha/beta hydrolase [Pseudodesulfovibrio sp.]
MDRFEAVETHGDNHVAGWVSTDDGARLWVDVHGRGRPLALVHGWAVSAAFWRRQIALADRCQVVTLDLRGHGRSPSALRGNTVPRYARDVHDVLDGLGIEDAVLAGWSMGGSVVLEYWREFGPDRLAGLGLIETCPHPMAAGPWNNHHFRDGNEAALNNDLRRMTEDRERFGKEFVDSMFLSGQAPSHALHWMLAEHLGVDTGTAAAVYRDYVRRDYTGVLPTVTIPTLCMYGRSRHMCYGASTGRFVAGSIPAARLALLERSGHLPFYEEADLFNAEITAFMQQLPG